ncbi:hypothetical protein BDR06DRAFT_969361 [Suillus hirtellus]|nr:hypothetical protein BDR06DRAFT_969361 [Suillus hirtellus]
MYEVGGCGTGVGSDGIVVLEVENDSTLNATGPYLEQIFLDASKLDGLRVLSWPESAGLQIFFRQKPPQAIVDTLVIKVSTFLCLVSVIWIKIMPNSVYHTRENSRFHASKETVSVAADGTDDSTLVATQNSDRMDDLFLMRQDADIQALEVGYCEARASAPMTVSRLLRHRQRHARDSPTQLNFLGPQDLSEFYYWSSSISRYAIPFSISTVVGHAAQLS